MNKLEKIASALAILMAGLLFLFVTFYVTPWIYSSAIKTHPSFTVTENGTVYGYGWAFEVISQVPHSPSLNNLGYVLKVKEHEEEANVVYVPRYDAESKSTIWESGKSTTVPILGIILLEIIFGLLLWAAVHWKNTMHRKVA